MQIPRPRPKEILTSLQVSPGVQVLHIERHMQSAVSWILRAHEAAGGVGISKGYSLLRGSWSPAYPETTGYTIPTMLRVASLLQSDDLRLFALSLADGLLDLMTPEGGVGHFEPSRSSKPIVFDTGQVIFGWLAAFVAGGNRRHIDAAVRAGRWLVGEQHSSGAWVAHQHRARIKVIDTRVAWALVELHLQSGERELLQSARKNLEWALTQQDEDGWFHACSLVRGEDPLTHTLAYTAEGLLECGLLLEEERYVSAAQKVADALIARQRSDGGLASTFGPGWRETSQSSCLTGDCQMACLWLRLYKALSVEAYREAAEKILRFVAGTQMLDSSSANLRGGIAGSYPVYGRYERFKYPNWAAKFFLDALIQLEQVGREQMIESYPG